MQANAVLLAGALLPASGHAQHPLVLQRLGEWNEAAPQPASDVLLGQIDRVARSLYPASPACPKLATIIEEVRPATSERYVFRGLIARQVRNGWTVLVRHPGCDDAPVRYMVIEESSGAFHTTRVNRGESLAHDSLIGDTLPLAVLQASAVLNRAGIACDASPADAQLGVVRIASRSPDLGPDVYGVRYSGSWSEEWPILLCARTVLVTVEFTADGDGGAYHRLPGDKARVAPGTAP